MSRTILPVKQTTDRQHGSGVQTVVSPGTGTSNRIVSPRTGSSTETRPAVTATKEETTPEVVALSEAPIHAGIAFSFTVKFHNREPVPTT